jgi:hypothetical protein
MNGLGRASFSGEVWHTEPLIPPVIQQWTLVVRCTCLIFLVTQLFGGVVRWVLDMAGAAAATYLPNVLMLGCVIFVLMMDGLYQRTTRGLLLFVTTIMLSMLVGYINIGGVVQVVFGTWVLTPFFFGIACAPVLLTHNRLTLWVLIIAFAVAAGGVVAHSFIAFPWVGVSYSIGGVELEGAREWQTTGGAQRLSGFARSSFDVAGQILMAAALLALQIRRGVFRLVMWGLSLAAISLSTSKGTLLALLMTGLAAEAVIRRKPGQLQFILAVGIAWMFVPPLMGWTMDWSQESRTDLNNPLYGSFIDRMNDMWPRAWQLGVDYGLPPLGRGMGGIGVPVSMFEPDLANAGDNLFVYCLVLLGVLSIPLFVLGYLALFKLCSRLHLEAVRQALVIAVAVNWYGGVSNILEHAALAFGFGLVCRAVVAQLSGDSMGERLSGPGRETKSGLMAS